MLAFFVNSVLLGIGLAIDAFSVSAANAMHNPDLERSKYNIMTGIFAFFQFIMPVIGWLFVRFMLSSFALFAKILPWIAFVIIGYLGLKMLIDGIWKHNDFTEAYDMALTVLLLEGVATSLDALSAGFTMGDYTPLMAFGCGLIIAAITFGLCQLGVFIGRRFGLKLAGRASIPGGIVLLIIAFNILIQHLTA